MSEEGNTEKCNAPRICQACDHGGSITIFHGAPVFCRLRKEIKKFDETCRDWKLIFSQHDEAREETPCPHCGTESYSQDERDYWKCGTIRYEEKCVVRTDLCNEREARKAAESKLAEAREVHRREREEAHHLLSRIARKGEFMDMEGQRLVVSDWLARRHISKKGGAK